MAKLLRRLSDWDKWAELAESNFWNKGDCPPELLSQLYDNSEGISVYSVDDDKDINRIIAAISLDWGTFKDCGYAVFSDQDLKTIGLELKNTKSFTFDEDTNQRHRDIVEISGQKLIKLVALVSNKAKLGMMTKEEIIKNLKQFLADDTFSRSRMFPAKKEKNEKNGKILGDLWRNKLVELA